MHSSPDDDKDDLFPASERPTTPRIPSSELSPPTSHGRGLFSGSISTDAPGSAAQPQADIAGLNENGKRSLAVGNADGKGLQTHASSGYQWEKDEDAPGYAWKNKRAADDANRAWDTVVEKDKMIGTRYGDVLAPRQGSGAAI